jgi:phage tail-like protein
MPQTDFHEAYRANQFTLTIDNIESPGFTSVTGLGDGEVESVDQPDGGSRYVRKVSSNIVKFDDITLERFMDGTEADTQLYQWFKQMFDVEAGAQGSKKRRSGLIKVRRADNKVVMIFSFEGAWIKSSKFTDLSAGGTDLMKQTIVLSIDRLKREPPVQGG